MGVSSAGYAVLGAALLACFCEASSDDLSEPQHMNPAGRHLLSDLGKFPSSGQAQQELQHPRNHARPDCTQDSRICSRGSSMAIRPTATGR